MAISSLGSIWPDAKGVCLELPGSADKGKHLFFELHLLVFPLITNCNLK
jgi:hypothetical protein